MTTYRIIGNMTGNSMDAIDLVLTEFNGDVMKDVASFTYPYTKEMQTKVEDLRTKVFNKTAAEIEQIPEFKEIHDTYIIQVANAIKEMLQQNNISPDTIDAIGFHGKTLDHNPPSKAKVDGTIPYTLQIGSGQMLADLTGIPVVYDFRSAYIMNNFDGAPLVPPHNAHISASEGDGCYYNGGNTSNFAWIIAGTARIGADAGPFNEYTDNFVRDNTPDSYDKDGKYGLNGKLNTELLQKIYDIAREYYERALPKSGDPQYYHKDKVFAAIKESNISLNDAIHTLEYFAAYIAIQSLTLTDKNWDLPADIILFGGGWKNPVVRQSIEKLLNGEGYVLPEHKQIFADFRARFATQPRIRYSSFGEYMEARLFADLARYKLDNRVWEVPEVIAAGQEIVSGVIAKPQTDNNNYTDRVNLAAKGWK